MWSLRSVLLVAHIVSAILFVGPFTLAASRFPSAARSATSGSDEPMSSYRKTSEEYAISSLAVPAFGVVLASESDWWSARWLQISIAVWAVGASLVFGLILPTQRRVVAALEAGNAAPDGEIRRLHAATGAASLSWVLVVALMVTKPW